jgi:hypothetical protein
MNFNGNIAGISSVIFPDQASVVVLDDLATKNTWQVILVFYFIRDQQNRTEVPGGVV